MLELDLNIETNFTRQHLNLKALVKSNNGSLILLCSKNIKKDESSPPPLISIIHLGSEIYFTPYSFKLSLR